MLPLSQHILNELQNWSRSTSPIIFLRSKSSALLLNFFFFFLNDPPPPKLSPLPQPAPFPFFPRRDQQRMKLPAKFAHMSYIPFVKKHGGSIRLYRQLQRRSCRWCLPSHAFLHRHVHRLFSTRFDHYLPNKVLKTRLPDVDLDRKSVV